MTSRAYLLQSDKKKEINIAVKMDEGFEQKIYKRRK